MKDNILKQDPKILLPQRKILELYDKYIGLIKIISLAFVFSVIVFFSIPTIISFILPLSPIFAPLQPAVISSSFVSVFWLTAVFSAPLCLKEIYINKESLFLYGNTRRNTGTESYFMNYNFANILTNDNSPELTSVKQFLLSSKYIFYPIDFTQEHVITSVLNKINTLDKSQSDKLKSHADLLIFILKSFQPRQLSTIPTRDSILQDDTNTYKENHSNKKALSDVLNALQTLANNNDEIKESFKQALYQLTKDHFNILNNINNSLLTKLYTAPVKYLPSIINKPLHAFFKPLIPSYTAYLINDFSINFSVLSSDSCKIIERALIDLQNENKIAPATKEIIDKTRHEIAKFSIIKNDSAHNNLEANVPSSSKTLQNSPNNIFKRH